METPEILASMLITPDGTRLQSFHRHDYKTYTDKNGKEYMLDGGLDYVRCSANGDEKLLTVTTSDPFEIQREHVSWGTRGKDGKQPLKHVPVNELETNHIKVILETQHHIYPRFRKLLETELAYRRQYEDDVKGDREET